MDSRIISVDSLSSSSAELQELMNMLGDPALESEFEEVDLREHAPQPTPTQESQDSNYTSCRENYAGRFNRS